MEIHETRFRRVGPDDRFRAGVTAWSFVVLTGQLVGRIAAEEDKTYGHAISFL
jgi:hypothetical protein